MLLKAASGQGIETLIRSIHGNAEHSGVASSLVYNSWLDWLCGRFDDKQVVEYCPEEAKSMVITVINSIDGCSGAGCRVYFAGNPFLESELLVVNQHFFTF